MPRPPGAADDRRDTTQGEGPSPQALRAAPRSRSGSTRDPRPSTHGRARSPRGGRGAARGRPPPRRGSARRGTAASGNGPVVELDHGDRTGGRGLLLDLLGPPLEAYDHAGGLGEHGRGQRHGFEQAPAQLEAAVIRGERPRGLRQRAHLQRDLGDAAEGPEGTGQEPMDVEAGDVLHDPRAALDRVGRRP